MNGCDHNPGRLGSKAAPPKTRRPLLWALWLLVAVSVAEAKPKSPIVPLAQVAPTIFQDIRYAGSENFIGAPIDGYKKGACRLTPVAAQALARVQRAARAQNLSLKVFDCYRPQRAVDHFCRWARALNDTRMKAAYYPGVAKNRLIADGYIAPRSGHSRGSTVDLTLVRSVYHVPARAKDCRHPEAWGDELDMGTSYDCFDPLSNTAHPAVTPRAKKNRALLVELMRAEGFQNYAKEWWHFTLADEPHPETYFDLPIE